MSAVFGIPQQRPQGCCTNPRKNVHETGLPCHNPYPPGTRTSSARAMFLSHSATACCPEPRPSNMRYPPSSRNPYPFPGLENDDTFKGVCHDTKQHHQLEGWQYRTQDPWNRIYHNNTLSSLRHQWCRRDPEAPDDKLDFGLKSTYNQFKDCMTPTNYVHMQRETLEMKHDRILRNRIYMVPMKEPVIRHPIRLTVGRYRLHPSSKKAAIGGQHTPMTNPGYSRKNEDGSIFFS